jgi:uncharacterized protein (TIGR02145 family)
MKKIFTLILGITLAYSCSTSSDGNSTETYETVQIGNQTWMKQNLKATKYKNGDPIPEVSDPTAWEGLTTGAYCKYPSTDNIYGNLYNWYAVNDPRGLAPNGWHIPTKEEWSIFADCLGGYLVAGEQMKEAGTSHWEDQPNPGNNISGFTGFGGGVRATNGDFVNLKRYGIWWTSSEFSSTIANYCRLNSNSKYLYFDKNDKKHGYSIRCIKN